jgi:hypothetical protein
VSQKEERERRRAERLAAEQREAGSSRRRLLFGYIVAGVLGAAVVIALVIAVAGGSGDGEDVGDLPDAAHIEVDSGFVHGFEGDGREGTPPSPIAQGDLEASAKAAGCELQLNLDDEGNTHLESPGDAPDYKSDPPTSGDHFAEQQADGAYAEFVDPVYWVHSLEHGRIVIQYSPDLPEKQQLELKGVFDQDPNGMLIFPNPEMKWEVAASAWTNLVGCRAYEGQATLDVLRNFRDIYRGNGPESFPTHLAG